MATEQDWGAYTDQAHVKSLDTLLLRTSVGAGVEVAGSHFVARRSDGGDYEVNGPIDFAPNQYHKVGGKPIFSGNGSTVNYLVSGGTAGLVVRNAADSANIFVIGDNGDSFCAGNLGVATASPTEKLVVQGAARFTANSASLSAGAEGAFIDFNPGSEVRLGHVPGASGTSRPVSIYSNGFQRLVVESGGHTRPGSDNTYAIGTSVNRWSVVYAVTGAINTSDERDKRWRGRAGEAELKAARRIVGELGFYQWRDAIAEKGGDWDEGGARLHFGVRAQAVWAIMADEGLVDPIGADGLPGKTPYAFLCFDEWEEEFEDEYETVTKTRIVHEASSILGVPREIEETYEERVQTGRQVKVREAGNRYGLRVDQLTLFLIAAQEARLAALEAA